MKLLVIYVLFALVAMAFSQERGACPSDCSNHGVCSSGTCNCNVGYTGADCSIPLSSLTSGQEVRGNVTTFQWSYYSISVSYVGSALNIFMNQTSSSGDCDIYVQVNTLPTRSVYYARDISTAKNTKLAVSNIQTTGTWYIGAYGFSACSYILKAQLTGSCPNDCSNNGICTSGVCTCNAGSLETIALKDYKISALTAQYLVA